MLLEEARQKISELIYSGQKHIDYPRTVEIDADAQTFISGENTGRLLIQILKRESVEAFAQRQAITKSITAEMYGSLQTPITDVVQNDMVRKGIRLDNERQRLIIEEKFKYWNGSMFNKSNGFDDWLQTRFKDLQGIGANSWIIAEWETPKTATEIIHPQPFEVPAEWALNFEFKNNALQWLLVGQPITYLKKKEPVPNVQSTTVQVPKGYELPFELPEYLQEGLQVINGTRYTLYTDQHAVVYEQIDKDYYVQQDSDIDLVEIKQGRYYAVRIYEHKLGFVPGFRAGYMDDPETAGRTKVPFWHRAKNTFHDSLIEVSQMRLAETVQNFPRPTRYVSKCKGDEEHPCNGGFQSGVMPRQKCKVCSGTGVQTITNPAEEILFPLPDDPTNDSMLDLSKTVYWDAPPSAPFEHMRICVDKLEPRAHRAVWGTTALIQTSGVTKTATEDENDHRQIQTALQPFAKHVSSVYRFFAYLFGKLAAADISKMDVYYEFQGELYRRGKAQLLGQRKYATDSGAPSWVIENIDETLADVQFAGDPYGRQIVKVQAYFRPFAGMNQAQIEYAIETGKVDNFSVVLWANYDAIFKELVLDNAGFYYITDRNQQWDLIQEKVNEFIEFKKAETPETTLPVLKSDKSVTS